MKIDWKVVSQSAGYISIKQCYADAFSEVNRSHQKWGHKREYGIKEAKKRFAWIISRAIHYAHHKQTTVDVILNEWEAKRTYSWQSYYGDQTFPRLDKNSKHVKPRSAKSWYLRDYKRDPIKRKHAYCGYLVRESQGKSKRQRNKARWSEKTKKQYKLKRSP